MQQCRLCLNACDLRNSHIVPEFLYEALYNNKNHMMGITGTGIKGWAPIQNGMKEHLFCEKCEQHFNEQYEKPFRKTWIENLPLPQSWEDRSQHFVTVDYAPFKLFHLSVLFRAGVCSLPTFSEVQLGPHEERLRNMILNVDPGKPYEYPILGHAVVHHKSKQLIQMVSRYVRVRYGSSRCYGIIYGGAQWWICVASDRNFDFEAAALQSDGTMPFIAIPWNDIPIIQEASKALNSPKLIDRRNSAAQREKRKR